MAEVRTRKLKADQIQSEAGKGVPKVQYSYRGSLSSHAKNPVNSSGQPANNASDLFRYDPTSLLKDMRRTFLIAALILLLLVLAKVLLGRYGI